MAAPIDTRAVGRSPIGEVRGDAGARQLAVRLPLPLVELWEELQPEVERPAGLAGLQIIQGRDRGGSDAARRDRGYQPRSGGVEVACAGGSNRSCRSSFAGQKVAVERPSGAHAARRGSLGWTVYARLQRDGRRHSGRCREGIVAGLTSRSYRRAVQSVLDGYGIEKSSVSREFVAGQRGFN